MSNILKCPWIESPNFETTLREKNLSPQDEAMCRFFSENGYLIIDEEFISPELTNRVIEDTVRLIAGEYKLQDAWKESAAIKALACNERVLQILELLYGRKPIPFQTLNFERGSQQKLHADILPFNSIPSSFMCGVWVALEDLNDNNGPLVYVPKSHRLPVCDYEDFGIDGTKPLQDIYPIYEEKVEKLYKESGLELKQLTIKKGQALVWAANLLHGGAPIKDSKLTRLSQVTHYFFEDCIYYTPIHSLPKLGEYYVRNITDVRTGHLVENTLNGKKLKIEYVPHTIRSRIMLVSEAERIEAATAAASIALQAPKPSLFGRMKRKLIS